MKIKYVGLKDDGETAFSLEPGAPAIWMKGDSFEVPEQLAKRMLNHPDVFAEDTGVKEELQAQAPEAPKTIIVKPDGTSIDIEPMTKEELQALAAELEVSVHHNAGAAKIKASLVAAFAADEEPAQ